MTEFKVVLLAILFYLITLVGIMCFMGLLTTILWNLVIPSVFGLGTITWMQGVGLFVICDFLFKGGSIGNKVDAFDSKTKN